MTYNELREALKTLREAGKTDIKLSGKGITKQVLQDEYDRVTRTTEKTKTPHSFIEVSKIDNFFSDSNKSFLDLDKVSRYTVAYQNGANFPPIEVVTEDNGRYTCYDGHHRLAVHRLLFIAHIHAVID